MMNYLRPGQPVQVSQPSGLGRWLFATYVAALIYASLFPITGWRNVDDGLFTFIFKPWPRAWGGFDVISNYLAYIPLGLVVCLRLSKAQRSFRSIVTSCLYGFGLSFSLEVMQNFLPTRVPSSLDIVFNTLGALTGALLGAAQSTNQAKLQPWQDFTRKWLKPAGRWAGVSLIVWIFVQSLFQPALFLTGEIPATVITNLLTGLGMEPGQAGEWVTEFYANRVGSTYSAIMREVAVVSLNLFIVTTLVFEFTSHNAARLPIGIVVIAIALVMKSFMAVYLSGSDPLYWLTIGAQAGLLVGALAALIATGMARKWRLMVCAGACIGLVLIANVTPGNPFQTAFSTSWRDRHLLSINGTLRHAAIVWPWIMAVICFGLALKINNKRS
jgi:VanZ family protein